MHNNVKSNTDEIIWQEEQNFCSILSKNNAVQCESVAADHSMAYIDRQKYAKFLYTQVENPQYLFPQFRIEI